MVICVVLAVRLRLVVGLLLTVRLVRIETRISMVRLVQVLRILYLLIVLVVLQDSGT